MSSYTLNTATGQVTRDDGVVVAPAQSVGEPNYVAYVAWIAAGNDPIVVNVPALGEGDYTAAVQGALDDAARARGYDSILSAASYAASSNPMFGPEGKAFSDWRDEVWSYCYTLLAQVKAGAVQSPTIDGLLAGLPTLTLPD